MDNIIAITKIINPAETPAYSGDFEKGKATARELVEFLNKEVPEVQLSLRLESWENPLHHDHITFISPGCEVWLATGKAVEPVAWKKS